MDKEYLKALGGSDSKAFELLFLRYQPKLLYFLVGFIHDEEVARDMAQDIFFSVWVNREKVALVDSFKSYLFRMARNAICNYYDHTLVCDKYTAEQLFQPTTFASVEERLLADDLRSLIQVVVEKMPPQRKQIFLLSRYDGLTNDAIAQRLQISKRTVENHLTTALADLRKAIKLALLFF